MITILGIHSFSVQVTDLLYKLAHFEDKETAYWAVLGLGLIACGTNNSWVSSLIKNLGFYYEENAQMQFVVRVSLGFLYAGKGLLKLD